MLHKDICYQKRPTIAFLSGSAGGIFLVLLAVLPKMTAVMGQDIKSITWSMSLQALNLSLNFVLRSVINSAGLPYWAPYSSSMLSYCFRVGK